HPTSVRLAATDALERVAIDLEPPMRRQLLVECALMSALEHEGSRDSVGLRDLLPDRELQVRERKIEALGRATHDLQGHVGAVQLGVRREILGPALPVAVDQ